MNFEKPPVNDPGRAEEIMAANRKKLLEGNLKIKKAESGKQELGHIEIVRDNPELAKKIMEENRRKLFGGNMENAA